MTRSIAPMYHTAVRRPTCLKDVLKAIKSGAISNSTELMRDVALLCANAIQFNGDEGEESVGHCAKLLWDRFERHVQSISLVFVFVFLAGCRNLTMRQSLHTVLWTRL